MRLSKILVIFFILFALIGCASNTSESSFESERKAKIAKLKEECDFVTVEYTEGEDLYICHTTASKIKKDTKAPVVEEPQGKEIPETPGNG